uniref:Uncharacterized protein n=1 Tax=Chenopodium quinoa TaxID=63459 RepID=A0A803MAS5_CHEQI
MDAPLTQVVIPFHPLLKQITSYLNFPDPDYQYVDVRKSFSCVAVRIDNGVVPTIYLGRVSVNESCEIVARKAVNSSSFQCLFSDYCSSPVAAKQNLARKVVDYLSVVFNLEIMDANYRATTCRFDAVLSALGRESYLNVKERVLGNKEQLEPSLVLVKQDCIAQVGKDFQVLVPIPPIITFNKIDLRSQVVESSAIADSDSEVF